MPTETQIIASKIRPYLEKTLGMRVFKIHGNAFTEVGTPDLICASRDHGFCAFEVKKPGNEPTPIQFSVLRSIRAAGGKAGVVYTNSYEKDIDEILYDKQL